MLGLGITIFCFAHVFITVGWSVVGTAPRWMRLAMNFTLPWTIGVLFGVAFISAR